MRLRIAATKAFRISSKEAIRSFQFHGMTVLQQRNLD
jgi:hypothetical protein